MSLVDVAVVGTGAVGLLLSYRFSQSGVNYIAVARDRERAALLKLVGVKVRDVDGAARHFVPKVVAPEEVTRYKPKNVFLAVKAYNVDGVARTMTSLVTRETAVVSLQNGIGSYEVLSERFSKNPVCIGLVTYGVHRRGLTEIVVTNEGEILVGCPKSPDVSMNIVELLRSAGIKARYVENIEGWRWAKLLINAGINPLTALLRIPNGVLLQEPELLELAKKIVEEGVAVARKIGVELPVDPVKMLVDVARSTSRNISSMLQDVLQCRETEVNYINGYIASKARELGLQAPLNEIMTVLVKVLSRVCRQGHPT